MFAEMQYSKGIQPKKIVLWGGTLNEKRGTLNEVVKNWAIFTLIINVLKWYTKIFVPLKIYKY
jgi:hypothetical protein